MRVINLRVARRVFRWSANLDTLAAVLIMVPPLSLAYYVVLFGVNVILYDEWAMVPLLQKWMEGTLSLSDLFAQHVGTEQRIFVHRFNMLIMERLTQFNTLSESFLSWILICSTGLLLLYHFRLYSRNRRRLIVFLPISLLLFDFRQWESLLVGFYNHIYLMMFALVATFTLLELGREKNTYFSLAVFASIVASFSWFVGLMVWPTGLLQIILQGGRRRLRVAQWSAIGAFTTGIYFYRWVKPIGPDFPSWLFVVTNPAAGGQYFLTMLGAAFTYNWYDAAAIGLVISLVGVFVLVEAFREGLLRKHRVYLSVTIFVALYLAVNTVGRAGLGPNVALLSYHTPITLLGIACLYLLAYSVSERHSAKHSFGAHALLALILIGAINGYAGGWLAGQQWREHKELGVYVLRTYRIQSDENIRAYLVPNASYVHNYAPFLEENKLNVFSQPALNTTTLKPAGPFALVSLDTINGNLVSNGSVPVINSTAVHTISITGWAVDTSVGGPAMGVFLIVDGHLEIPTLYGLDRRDIATVFNNPNFEYCGFIATFSSLVLSHGTHSISIMAVSQDGLSVYEMPEVVYVEMI